VDELPTGMVTFLFSDIEGSTRLLRQLGSRYAEVLAKHRRLLRSAFRSHHGYELATEGDSFVVVFYRASDAVGARWTDNGRSRPLAGRGTARCVYEWGCTPERPSCRTAITWAWMCIVQ